MSVNVGEIWFLLLWWRFEDPLFAFWYFVLSTDSCTSGVSWAEINVNLFWWHCKKVIKPNMSGMQVGWVLAACWMYAAACNGRGGWWGVLLLGRDWPWGGFLACNEADALVNRIIEMFTTLTLPQLHCAF